jgi:hypothetical protein
MPWPKGQHHTKEQNQKTSETLKGHPHRGQFQKGDSPWNKGLKGIQLSNTGQFIKGHIPWNKGLPMLEETRHKVSCAKKGQVSSFRGKHHSEEANTKNANAHKGHVAWNKGLQFSAEACQKMSISRKILWQMGIIGIKARTHRIKLATLRGLASIL